MPCFKFYIQFYLKNKQFPSLEQFIQFCYEKTQKPIHKDIENAYNIIHESYLEVRDYIENNKLDYQ